MTRRRLLVGAGGTATAAAAGGLIWRPRPSSARPPGRVVVVGAGLAGLTAAYELRRAGWQVIVLEARERVGGRVMTLREPLLAGQHAELGGEYIDAVHTALLRYARRFELRLEDATAGFGGLDDGVYLRRIGRLRPAHAVFGPRQRAEAERFWVAISRLSRGVRLVRAGHRERRLDRRSAADLLDRLRIDGLGRRRLEGMIRDEYGVEPERASLLGIARQERVYAGVPGRKIEIYRIEGGNDRLPLAFAARLGPSLRLGAVVEAIAQDGGGVRVTIAGGETIAADHVVVAAPLPALRSIEFEPALTPRLAAVIAELRYAHVTKTVLQYPRRFWRQRGYSGDVSGNLRGLRSWEATDQQGGRPGALINYLAGDESDRVSEMPTGKRHRRAAAAIARAFPHSPGPIAAESACWQLEEFSGGCWASPEPGQAGGYGRALLRPHGRIFLAGEHAAVRYSGYMEGAIRSGRRAAAAVIEAGAA